MFVFIVPSLGRVRRLVGIGRGGDCYYNCLLFNIEREQTALSFLSLEIQSAYR